MSDHYDTAPMAGTFLADLSKPGDTTRYQHPIQADNLAHLDHLLTDYASRHGFTVEGVTFAGRRVPGFGGTR